MPFLATRSLPPAEGSRAPQPPTVTCSYSSTTAPPGCSSPQPTANASRRSSRPGGRRFRRVDWAQKGRDEHNKERTPAQAKARTKRWNERRKEKAKKWQALGISYTYE